MGEEDAGRAEVPDTADGGFDALLKEVARTPAVGKVAGDSFGGGRYVVQRPLGRGGQKDVFLVRDTVLERDCALSVVQTDTSARAQLDRFRREARALARFGAHPNIVTIYDLGEENGFPYTLCEYLEGGDLRAAMTEGEALPIERALRIARDVARALVFAHERGVVHRDVSPANVWLLGDGTAKLGDFGLALVIGQTRATAPGTILGTPAYLSPDPALGREMNAKSDVYSLGCVLYELVTGYLPFESNTVAGMIYQHVHAAPLPPSERNRALDPALEALVLRMLDKDPDRRPLAREVLAELERSIAPARRGPPIPDNEAERLAAVHALGILDTPPETAYDELAELAAQMCGCPIGYICFIDEARQWLKANVGMPPEMASAPREAGVCQTTICQSDVLVAPDCAADERFRDLPPVAGPPHFRFYAGAPLITRQGYALGTIVVMDFEARELSFQQIESVRRLARQAVAQIELRQKTGELDRAVAELASAQKTAETARKRADELLCNIFPAPIAAELTEKQRVEPRYHESVTLGLAELRGFDRVAAQLDPARLVHALDDLFCTFDALLKSSGIEKLKTVDGTYVFASGLPEPRGSHPVEMALAAIALRQAARRVDRERARLRLPPWELAIGLHTGAAMSGVVGEWKLAYDAWGETVRLAQRVASATAPDRIAISETTQQRIAKLFVCEPSETLAVEDRAPLRTFFLDRIRPELSADAEGARPNERFHDLARRLFRDYVMLRKS